MCCEKDEENQFYIRFGICVGGGGKVEGRNYGNSTDIQLIKGWAEGVTGEGKEERIP